MRLPVLSPYLRPVPGEPGFAVDNAVAGTIEPLGPTEQAVVRALWLPRTAPQGFARVIAEHGFGAVAEAVAALRDRGLAFDDARTCDAHALSTLAASVPDVPFVDQIELTNKCPMTCGFCPRGIPGRMQRPQGFMSRELFRSLLDQLPPGQAEYRPLELHHLGESLLHPEVDGFVRDASERGLPTELSANPALLTPELGRRLLDAGLRRLVLSLDGMDDETLVALRGKAARYSRAEPNLDALFSYAQGLAQPPRIVLQMIDLSRNRHQRQAFLERWGTSGLPFVEAYVKDLDGPDPDTHVASSKPTRYLCTYPWRSVVVLWDGRVVPCCRDDDARHVLGDLSTTSLRDIWHGPAATALRDAHARLAFAAGHLCAGCGWRRDAFAQAAAERTPDIVTASPLVW